MCSFINEAPPDDRVDWLVGSGASVDNMIGPAIDHTIGTNKVYYNLLYCSCCCSKHILPVSWHTLI